MAKRIIKLNENEFRKFIAESIMAIREQELGLDNLPDTDYEDDYYRIGPELSQEERWSDYDKAENELNDIIDLDDDSDFDEYDDLDDGSIELHESKINEGSTSDDINNDWSQFVQAFDGNLEYFAETIYSYLRHEQIEEIIRMAKKDGFIADDEYDSDYDGIISETVKKTLKKFSK